MTERLHELFAIDIRHGYFADERCAILDVSPTRACMRLLERHRLRWRPLAGGGSVHAWRRDSGVSSDDLLVRAFDEPSTLAFVVTSRDDHINRYTADAALVSVPSGLSVMDTPYFTNIGGSAMDVDGSDAVLLHSPTSPLSSIALSSPLEAADAHRNAKRPWALIEILTGPRGLSGKDIRAVLGGPRPEPRRFAIRLTPRETYWRYCVLSATPDPIPAEGVTIAMEGPTPVSFERGDPVDIGGQDAACFESSSPLALLQHSHVPRRVTLTMAGVDGRTVSLPSPPPRTTRPEHITDKNGQTTVRIVSEQLVYV